MTTTESSHTPTTDDRRRAIGTVAAIVSVLGAALAPALLLSLLSQDAFASDFEMGTHDADYSAMPIFWGAVVVAVIASVLGALAGRGPGRAVCVLVLIPPAFVLLSGLVNLAL